jgi:hypothetical protein
MVIEVANQKANISRKKRRMTEFYSFAAAAVQVIRPIGIMFMMILLFHYKYEMTLWTLRDLTGRRLGMSTADRD